MVYVTEPPLRPLYECLRFCLVRGDTLDLWCPRPGWYVGSLAGDTHNFLIRRALPLSLLSFLPSTHGASFVNQHMQTDQSCYKEVSKLFFPFFFLGPHWWHMEVPRLGVKLEIQLLAYTTATAALYP